MNAVLETTTLLMNKLRALLNILLQYVNFDSLEEAYKVVFELFYQASRHKPFLLKNLHKDARLSGMLQYAEELLSDVYEVISERNIDVLELAREMFRRASAELAEASKSASKYVIVCDGLSIIDALYIACRLKREGAELFIAPIINPGGATETYKFILEPHSYIQNADLTLNDIARRIAEKMRAKDYIVFRDYDEFIHQLKSVRASDIIGTMYTLTSKLYSKITQLKGGFGSTIIMLSDHGYDIVEKEGGLYDVNHSWSPRSLSVIASLLIV